jgi:hypothetical protein
VPNLPACTIAACPGDDIDAFHDTWSSILGNGLKKAKKASKAEVAHAVSVALFLLDVTDPAAARLAYLRLSLLSHPDKQREPRAIATVRFQLLLLAWEVVQLRYGL